MTGPVNLLKGDCRLVLPTLEANSVHAVVCDPPYGLEFMGKDWDNGVPGVHFWTEIIRVARPGCHLLAFGGTRTFHRLACAIEDAGWEIRDTLMWVYGSGFPKSLDVSKAIDKHGEWNAEFDEVRSWLRQKVTEKGLKHSEIDKAIGNENSHMASHFLGTSQPMLPTWEQWVIIKRLLGVDEDIDRPPKCVGYERAIIGYRKCNPGVAFTSIGPTELPITEPASDSAKQWNGWGTALKPAWEPIILARKPLDGTVAENVQKWGTGALNIDGCRVPYNGKTDPRTFGGKWKRDKGQKNVYCGGYAGVDGGVSSVGRWPANVIHDGSQQVLDLFPESKSTGGINGGKLGERIYGRFSNDKPASNAGGLGDSGSAARFFYCAKASRQDRDEGCEGMDEKRVSYMNTANGNPDKGEEWQPIDDRTGQPRNRFAATMRNNHPTVKPTALMRYLCRLVTPPNGIILDPFMGSGSTGKAAVLDDFSFIGIELDEGYMEIAEKRINHQLA